MESENQQSLSEAIKSFIKGRETEKLEKLYKERDKALKSAKEGVLDDIQQRYLEKEQAEKAKFEPVVWLNHASKRATQIQYATHALKFTHSDAKGSSIYALGGDIAPTEQEKNTLLSQANTRAPKKDVVGNAASLDLVKLLDVSDGEQALFDCIENNDISPFLGLSNDEEQAQAWLSGFQDMLTIKEKSSHKLAKQVYFPVGDGSYHLIAPLFSSSLNHECIKKVDYEKFGEGEGSDNDVKVARSARREEQYSKFVISDYPNLAQKNFGGTKPQNISQLNSQHGGKAYLFSSAPPTWTSQEKIPLNTLSVIPKLYSYQVRKITRDFQNYLISVKNKPSNKKIRNKRQAYVDLLLEELINFAAKIQQLETGWSNDPQCKLNESEQLWLDPDRAKSDEQFKHKYDLGDWRSEIADSFARWLNRRLRDKDEKLPMADAEFSEWKSQLQHCICDNREFF